MGSFEGVRGLLERFGYTIRPSDELRPVDMRDRRDDPRLFDYAGGERPVLIEVSLARGRGLGGCELTERGAHPWVCAIREARSSNRPRSVIREVLDDYYRAVQPSSAAEWLDLEDGAVPALEDQPPWARVWPWEGRDIETRRNKAEAAASVEGEQFGRNLTIEDGWNNFGPVSDRLLEMETDRLFELMQSIRRYGYRRKDRPGGDIDVAVLWNDEDQWGFKTTGGAHRAAVLAGLGYEQIPVRITRMVRRKDVDIWPNVSSGLYSREQAVALFDRILEGQRPSVLDPWVDQRDASEPKNGGRTSRTGRQSTHKSTNVFVGRGSTKCASRTPGNDDAESGHADIARKSGGTPLERIDFMGANSVGKSTLYAQLVRRRDQGGGGSRGQRPNASSSPTISSTRATPGIY